MSNTSFSVEILNTNSTTHEEYEHFFTFFILMRDATGLVLFPMVCLLGLPANLLGIIVMSRKEMRSSTTVFLIGLAITDSVKIVVDLLYFVYVLLITISPQESLQFYVYLYPFTHYIFNATMMSAAWITVAVAVERYVAVCHAYKAQFICTITQSTVLSFFITVTSFLMSIPYVLRYKNNNTYQNETADNLTLSQLWKHDNFGEIFNWFHYAMRSLVPLILLIFFSICIQCGLRKRRYRHKNRRISVCISAVIITFIVCVFPDTVMSTIFQTGCMKDNYLAKGIQEITDFLVLTHTFINFVIYCIFNPQFLKTFKTLYICYTKEVEKSGRSCPRSRTMTMDPLIM